MLLVRLTLLWPAVARNKEVIIPHAIERDQIVEFIASYTVDEQVDLLCVCEALSIRFLRSKDFWPEKSTIEELHKFFDILRFIEPLRKSLKELNLVTSSGFVMHGKTLLLPTYHF